MPIINHANNNRAVIAVNVHISILMFTIAYIDHFTE